MTEPPIKILTPAEYRRRAERCQRMADAVPATRDDFIMAAHTWESLAQQAEALLGLQAQLERGKAE